MLFYLIHIIYESEVTEAFECALFYKFLASAVANAKSVHTLLQGAVLAHQFDHFLCVPDGSIGQKVDMRGCAFIRSTTPKNLGERLIDTRAAKICSKFCNFGHSNSKVHVVIVDTALIENKFMIRAVAADIEHASSW